MDPRIENLKSTTFFGKRLRRRQIADIQTTVSLYPGLGRRELGSTICEHLGWFTPNGDYRVQACLRMLEQLEELGILRLPAKRESMRRGPQKPPAEQESGAPEAAIACGLQELAPLSLRLAREAADIEAWNGLVDQHHYLGYRRPFGRHLRYFLLDGQGRRLGCLLFTAGATQLPCRDAWIGWGERERAKRLEWVVCNSRFLLFPWVRVKCLASKALSMALRRLAEDWAAQHGYRPALVETFIDPERFDATCYRAANWRHIGRSKILWGSGEI